MSIQHEMKFFSFSLRPGVDPEGWEGVGFWGAFPSPFLLVNEIHSIPFTAITNFISFENCALITMNSLFALNYV